MINCFKCGSEPWGYQVEHNLKCNNGHLQCIVAANCFKCKTAWPITQEEIDKLNIEIKLRHVDSYKEVFKKRRRSNGTWKMTRWMTVFETWLFRRSRKLGWKWTRLRYKFMQ